MEEVKKISIVGAGLVGTLMSIYLARRGYKVSLFETRSDMRKTGAEGGRSINLALSNRGSLPLKEVGLADAVEKLLIPMRGRMMHDEEGFLTFQPYGRQGQAIYSVPRFGLNKLLLNEAEKVGVALFFDKKCVGINFDKNILFFGDHGQRQEVKSDAIIGSDGAYSVVRRLMQRTARFNYSQYYIEHGYKELTIPPAANHGFKIEKNALHIWPRGNYMLIALPNKDGSFTVTLFFPFEGNPSFQSLKNKKEMELFFKNTFPDAYELMPTLMEDYENNPTASLVTIKCFPWIKNKTLLIGDASHAIVPFYGQGMNSGFEDCRILNGLLDQYDNDWVAAIRNFNKMRKKDADAISKLALQNFNEMRDLVGDKDFLLRKKIEAKLNDLYPDRWIPLYSMVTFNEKMSYADALKIGEKQKVIMDEVMQTPKISRKWEKLDFESIVKQLTN